MKTEKWTDPIVDEIHRVREEIDAEFDHDLHKLCEFLREREQTREASNGVNPPETRIP
jgi:hypothetical protein